jgi:hypothetical protein
MTEGYSLEQGIIDACERAKREQDRVNVYSDGLNVWVRLARASAPSLPGNAYLIGTADPSGEITILGIDEYYIHLANDHYGNAVRDNSRSEKIAIGKRLEQEGE